MPSTLDPRRPHPPTRTAPRLGCVDCGAFFTPPSAPIPRGLRCPRCGGRFVPAGPRAVPDKVVLARVDLQTTEDAPLEDAPGAIVEKRVEVHAAQAPRAARRLVRLRRRGAQAPTANVLALPANLGKHAPPVPLDRMTCARLPQPERGRRRALLGVAGALILAAAITVVARPASAPLARTLRTLQTRVARTLIAVQTPISNTLTAEPIDVETDPAAGVALVHGVLHNGTPEALADVRIEVVLMADGRPFRRRVVRCCDDLDVLDVARMGPTHPHLSQGGARPVTLARDVQEPFSAVFQGIEARHLNGELRARLTIQAAGGVGGARP